MVLYHFNLVHYNEKIEGAIFDPIYTLKETIKDEDWFKGIVLSATYLERYGILKLKEHYKGIINEKSLSVWD